MWVRNVHRNFGIPKQCIGLPKHNSFSSFCLHSGSEMLENTPKYHFGTNGGYWVRSCENVRQKFSAPKQCISRNAPVSHCFACIRVAKCSKTPTNIILGLMEAIGCVLAKTFDRSSVPQSGALVYRNAPVSNRFACIPIAECSKTLSNIIWV